MFIMTIMTITTIIIIAVDGKNFPDIPMKIKEGRYEKKLEMSKNNDYTTGNSLDYVHFLKHKLIAIDLSK